MIRLLILGLLVAGSIQDIRRREVSPYITAAIAILSVAYLLNLPYLPYVYISAIDAGGFFWLHILTASGTAFAHMMKAAGGAEVKAIIPLLFTLHTLELYLFLVVAAIIHAIIHFKIDKRAPYFIAAAGAYAVVLAI